jgi:hypothetical protein
VWLSWGFLQRMATKRGGGRGVRRLGVRLVPGRASQGGPFTCLLCKCARFEASGQMIAFEDD